MSDDPIPQAEWLADARRRFGDDPMGWKFRCPQCGDVATGAEFKAALDQRLADGRGAEDRAVSDVLGQECIGRSLGALETRAGQWDGRGCDWTAYGLFGGPVGVLAPNGKVIRAFEFAS